MKLWFTFLFFLFSTIFFGLIGRSASVVPSYDLLGISPEDEFYYKALSSSGTIKCKDGSKKFTKSRLNDDYCDCPDGTDEPGTSACPEGKFYCRNAGHVPLSISSSGVNDGICDCCDGSDEYDGKVKCPNTCWEAGKVARNKLKQKIATYQEGITLRKQEIEQAKLGVAKDEAELSKLKIEEKILKGLVQQLKEHKEQIEKAEEKERLQKEKEEKEKNEAVEAQREKSKDVEEVSSQEKPFKSTNDDHIGLLDDSPLDEDVVQVEHSDDPEDILEHADSSENEDLSKNEVQEGAAKKEEHSLVGHESGHPEDILEHADSSENEDLSKNEVQEGAAKKEEHSPVGHESDPDISSEDVLEVEHSDDPEDILEHADSSENEDLSKNEVQEGAAKQKEDSPVGHESGPDISSEEKDASEDAEMLSKEKLGRLVASRWTGDNTDKESGEVDAGKDDKHEISEEAPSDAYDEEYEGYDSESEDDSQNYIEDDEEEDHVEDFEEEKHDDFSSPDKSASDDELEVSDITTSSSPSWLEKIQHTVRNILQAVNLFQTPVNVSEAARVRKEYDESSSKLSKIQSRISSLTKKLSQDFGPEKEFYSFFSKCFEIKENKYVYKICPFKQASQEEGHGVTRLGNWDKFEDSYKSMLFSSGDKCWNGPDRSLKVRLRCGLKNEATDVDEPSRCEYVAMLSTPLICLEEKLKELQDKMELMNKELPQGHDEL